MKVEHLVYTNKATNEMFDKYIKGKQITDVLKDKPTTKISDVTTEQLDKECYKYIQEAVKYLRG